MRVVHPKDLLAFLKTGSGHFGPMQGLMDAAPNYSARDGTLYLSEEGRPKLKWISKKLNLFQANQIAHIRDSQVALEDGTRINSNEALYDIRKSRIIFAGNVESTFKTGAVIQSEIAYLDTKPSLHLWIPLTEKVQGRKTNLASPVLFESQGLDYSDSDHVLQLLSEVKVKVSGTSPLQIASDRCAFLHDQDLLRFSMDDSKIIEKQFIEATDPKLLLRSRKLEVKLQTGRQIEEIIALQDVFFEDTTHPDAPTQGTGGKGVYRVKDQEITLTDFPQLYQDRDTVTGDLITYNRKTERVEVTQSNAIYNAKPTNR